MDTYNPDKKMNPETWLALDEDEQQELIEEYVLTEELDLGDDVSFTLHAAAHTLVETQLAMDEKDTVDAYDRLIRQGLKRHETIHALAAVIFEGVHQSMQENMNEPGADLTIRYKSRLRKLTAKKWLKGKY